MSGPVVVVGALVVLLVVLVVVVARWGRLQRETARRRAAYLEEAFVAAEVAACGPSSAAEATDRVCARVRDLLGADSCRYEPCTTVRPAVRLCPDGTVRRHEFVRSVERDGLPPEDETAIAVRAGGVTLGHLMVTAASRVTRPGLERRRLAVLLADELGAALGHCDRVATPDPRAVAS